MPPVTIRISNDLLVPARVQGVLVEFYNLSGVFQTSGTTDGNGEVSVTLAVAQYDVFMAKPGVSILPKQPQRIDVLAAPASNLFLVSAHERVLPESSSTTRCRVTGYFLDPGGRRMQKPPRLSISLVKSLTVLGGEVVSPIDVLDVSADQNGYFDFELIRGATYKAYIGFLDEFFGIIPAQFKLCVPDLPGLELSKLFFPVPVGVEFSDDELDIELVDGCNESITYEQVYSDETAHPGGVPWSFIRLTNSNPEVVQAGLQDGKLVVIPLAAGTTTLSTERVISEVASYVPAPAFTPTTVVVTVT